MPRFYLSLVLIPLAIFTASLMLIRTLPNDAYEIRQLLLPEGCPNPCLMGIRPGITTMDEAAEILQANPWVGQIEKEVNNFGETLKWNWNDRTPKRIIPTSSGLISAVQTSGKSLVEGITISSFLQLGEVYVVLGLPDTEKIGSSGYSVGEQYAYVNYMALYDKENLFLIFDQSCRTGYPTSGNGEVAGLPFTTPVHIIVGTRFTLPASGERISIHSPIHYRLACGS
ncbi:MAG: hypothetical protein GC179_12525 [Anaerolineaceae bacterium]|nr:hypothetical protein [Anaerolineaceae bacterium]